MKWQNLTLDVDLDTDIDKLEKDTTKSIAELNSKVLDLTGRIEALETLLQDYSNTHVLVLTFFFSQVF